METLRAFGSSVSVEMSTVVLVKNRCQFCHAFFNDPEKIAEHSYQCKFRFSETFEAFDGKMKFACAVSAEHLWFRSLRVSVRMLSSFTGLF